MFLQPKAELWRRVQDAGIVAKSWVSDFTGYEAIETLKVQESSHHAAFVQAKEDLKDLQGAYAKAGGPTLLPAQEMRNSGNRATGARPITRSEINENKKR
jgi:hypothetical protein